MCWTFEKIELTHAGQTCWEADIFSFFSIARTVERELDGPCKRELVARLPHTAAETGWVISPLVSGLHQDRTKYQPAEMQQKQRRIWVKKKKKRWCEFSERKEDRRESEIRQNEKRWGVNKKRLGEESRMIQTGPSQQEEPLRDKQSQFDFLETSRDFYQFL